MKDFYKAKAIFPLSLKDEINLHLIYTIDFKKEENISFSIACYGAYQVYLNGKFLSFGPSRSAKGEYRIAKLDLKHLSNNNRLVIFYASYNDHCFIRDYDDPFIQFELRAGRKILACSNKDVNCYINPFRRRKVQKYSYQRDFLEQYKLDKSYLDLFKYNSKVDFEKVKVDEVGDKKIIKTITLDSNYNYYPLSIIESGTVSEDLTKPVWIDDRMRYDDINQYRLEEIDLDDYNYLYRLKYKHQSKKNVLESNQFSSYKSDGTKVGFLNITFTAIEDSELFLTFDEIFVLEDGDEEKELHFTRAGFRKYIRFVVKKGTYTFSSFEPYSIQFVRAIVRTGKVIVNQINVISYENPLPRSIEADFKDEKLNLIFKSAINSYRHNALDIFMDCPHRERAGWLCDSFFTGLAETYITGNNLTEKAFLENYAHYESSPFLDEIDKNIIPMCYPASFPRKVFIYNWCQFYVIELYNYIYRYNDRNLLNESKRNISRILEFGKQFENEYGLLEDVKGWQFLEWSHANDKESVEGVNFSTNFIYGRMLICAGKLLDDKELINKGLKVLETADRLSFDGLLYHDNAIRVDGKLILTDRISETSQYYALYFGNIDIDKKKEFFDIVINKLGPKRDADKIYPNVFPSAPFIGNYLRLMILAKYGYYEKIKDETVDYLYYMAKETKTLWEMKNDLKSLDHGFTSYIVNLLVEVYTSIRFISPKEKTIYVSKYKPIKNSEINISIPLFDGKKLIFKDGQIILPRGWKIIQGK